MYAKEDRSESSNVFPIIEGTSSKADTAYSGEPIPRTAKEISEIYSVSDRAIQGWYRIVLQAHPWINETDLKVGKSAKTKYTVLCQRLIEAYRQSGMGSEEWILQIQAQNANILPKERLSPGQSLKQFGLTPVEVVEGADRGQIETAIYTVQPLLPFFHVEDLSITVPVVNTSEVDELTTSLLNQTNVAAEMLQQFVTADLRVKLAALLAQNTNLAAGLQNAAVVQAVQSLGKPVEGGDKENSFRPS